MPFVDAAKNTMLDALTIDLIKLHSGDPGTDGLSNLITDAEAAAVVNAASGGSRALNADVDVSIGSAVDVYYVSFWENLATDVYHGYAPNGPPSNNPRAAYAEATADEIRLDGHGLSDGDTVIFFPLADALPAGLSERTVYYVITSDADSFQVSLTEGGSAVDITADGDLVLQQLIIESYAQAGTHTVKAGTAVAL